MNEPKSAASSLDSSSDGSTNAPLAVNADPKRFAMFVITVLLAMAASSYVATLVLLRTTYAEVQQDFVEELEARLQGNIDFYLRAHLAALTDHARLPRLVNSVMNPSGRAAVVKDRLRQLKLLDGPANFWLLDIQGEVIAQDSKEALKITHEPLVMSILEGDQAQVAEIFADPESGELWLRFMVPVRYNGLPEGLLLADQRLDTNNFSSGIRDDEKKYVLEFRNGEELLGSIGGGHREALSTSFAVPNLINTIALYVDTRSIDKDLYELLLINVIISLILVGLFLWFFRRVGDRLFVRPLQQLAEAQVETNNINARLEIANDELSQFAYRSSHDLRAPLATVLGLAKFAKSDLEAGDLQETKANLEKIGLHVEKLDLLVGNILEMSRADFDDVQNSTIDVIALAKKLQKDLNVEGLEQVDFRYSSETQLPFVSQETRMIQILDNLLSNAVKYRSNQVDQSYVAVRVSSDESNYYLEVSDNGIGIPEQQFDEVFGMFKRFHPNVATGTGLGLSIVKKHVDRLGGDIRFGSSSAGTTLTIAFPLRSEL